MRSSAIKRILDPKKLKVFGNLQKKLEKHKNSAKFRKCQKWSPGLDPLIWRHLWRIVGDIVELLAVLGSEFLCKWPVFNFKSAISQPITGFHYFGISKKSETHKNSAKFQKWQNWSAKVPPPMRGDFEWNVGHFEARWRATKSI